MLNLRRTLKARLTIYHVLIFGLSQAALWITVDVVRSNQLRRRLQAELVSRAQAILQVVQELAETTNPTELDAARLTDALRPHFSPKLFIQVELPPIAPVQSPNLGGFRFPGKPLERWPELLSGPTIHTAPAEIADALTGPDGHLKLATLYQRVGHDQLVCVKVGLDDAPLEESIVSTRRLLVVFMIISLIVASVTSWFMVQRSLSPVAAVVKKARRIRGSRLKERIVRPAADDEITQMIDVINEMLDRLEADFRNQQQFISHVSHELKTPLSVILSECQNFEAGLSNVEDHQQFVGQVRQQAEQVLRVVESFLLLARARSGGGLAVKASVPVEDIVIEATRRTRAKALNFQVKVVPLLEFPEENPEPTVRGDADLLYSMLENVVRNAIRHSSPGEAVEVIAKVSNKQAVLSVRDRGDGIPPDHLDKIFELFHQVSPESKRSGKLGVGLSIARAVTELHGATIVARNREGGGAEFTITLPIEPPR